MVAFDTAHQCSPPLSSVSSRPSIYSAPLHMSGTGSSHRKDMLSLTTQTNLSGTLQKFRIILTSSDQASSSSATAPSPGRRVNPTSATCRTRRQWAAGNLKNAINWQTLRSEGICRCYQFRPRAWPSRARGMQLCIAQKLNVTRRKCPAMALTSSAGNKASGSSAFTVNGTNVKSL